jgi:DNA polymerase III alpha subunit (gram-positive type)
MLHNLTIIDFETTGFQGDGNRAIEVAAVKLMHGEIVSQFQTVINQPVPVSAKITELTKITQADVDNGMPEKMAFAILNNLSAGTTLVAHNMLFDWWFYNDALQRIGGRELTADMLCSLTMSREVLGGAGHKLEQLMERFDLKFSGAHRALNDVLGTLQILRIIDGKCDVNEYLNKLAYKRWFKKPQFVPANCYVYPQD